MSYTSGVINIPHVTGNIVITATATTATVSSISAVFVQGQNVVYDTDSLDTLKQYLTVTATYADSSTAVVTNYTLSGTLAEGTSTITVTYGGFTDTFDVTVTSATTTLPITWTGSSTTKASQMIDATNASVYLTFPYVEGYSGYAEGATRETDFVHIRVRLYDSAEATTPVGYYWIDTEEIDTTSRTDVNAPSMPVDTEIKIAPSGYYVGITLIKRTTGFTSNSTFGTFITTYVTSAKLVADGGD